MNLMDNPFFSIIVPAHNSSQYIRKGLNSIKEQTFTDYELIIICDACIDNTVEIAKEYSNLVYEINAKTPGAARNLALDKAMGKWIIFMDDDDWFLTNQAFEKLANKCSITNKDIITFNFIHGPRGFCKGDIGWVAIWNKVWRKSFVNSKPYRFTLWDHGEDALFAKETKENATWENLNETLYYYNYPREGSIRWREEHGEFTTHEYKNI